jgi:hypothetical protein
MVETINLIKLRFCIQTDIQTVILTNKKNERKKSRSNVDDEEDL